MTSFKINIANIKDVHPSPIHCLALNDNIQKLALFRGGDVCAIEIWDVSHMPFLEKILVELEKVEEKPSVESIVWARNRLFTGGLHGFVLEHSLVTRRVKEKLAATSGPVWCLSVNSEETFLAAGTEDGFINIFEITQDSLMYIRVLDRQDGRVLSLSWSPCDRYIATGSVDSVRLWDVEKGHALRRLMTGRSKNKETIVWSILLLDNLNIVSGDSRGVISFWNGEIGVLRFKIYSHKADVLSLRLSSDQSSIYAAGVDPVVVMLARVGKYGDRWVKSHQRSMHTNDVTSLATTGNKLYSAGYDGDLIVSSFPPKVVTKYPPLTSSSNITMSKMKKLILVQNVNRLDIWKLPSENQELTKVLELESQKKETILSSCISSSGVHLAYSTFGKISVFELSISEVNGKSQETTILAPQLSKIKFEPSDDDETRLDLVDHPQWHMRFIDDACLALVSVDGGIICFATITDENDKRLTVKCTIELGDVFRDIGVDRIEVSLDGKYLAIVSGGLVVVNQLRKQTVSNSIRLPQYRCPITLALFHPKSPLLLVAYVDRCVKLFNLATEKIVLDTEIRNSNCLQPLLGGSWSPTGDTIVLYDLDGMHLLELSPDIVKPKKKKTSGTSKDERQCEFSIKSGGNKYKFVAFVEFLDDGKELLAVEVKPSTLLEKLPPAFVKKRFGM